MTKAERIERANRVCQHLEGKPQFRQNGALELAFAGWKPNGERITVTRTVVVDRRNGILRTCLVDPWGSNQSRTLALLARWIRTGKMAMPLSWWECICEPPVLLGDGGLFEAVEREIFGVGEVG